MSDNLKTPRASRRRRTTRRLNRRPIRIPEERLQGAVQQRPREQDGGSTKDSARVQAAPKTEAGDWTASHTILPPPEQRRSRSEPPLELESETEDVTLPYKETPYDSEGDDALGGHSVAGFDDLGPLVFDRLAESAYDLPESPYDTQSSRPRGAKSSERELRLSDPELELLSDSETSKSPDALQPRPFSSGAAGAALRSSAGLVDVPEQPAGKGDASTAQRASDPSGLRSPEDGALPGQAKQPAVLVSPPVRVISDYPPAAAPQYPHASPPPSSRAAAAGPVSSRPSAPPPSRASVAPPPVQRELEEGADELTLEDGDVEESLELSGERPSHERIVRTPPPPPPAGQPAKRRPPPPPSHGTGPGRRPSTAPPGQPAPPRAAAGWWETVFSEEYLQTYVPPTSKQIARQCDFFWEVLGLQRGQTVLDVGCGLGLHAIELTRRGCLVVGIDLSLPMITRAAEEAQQQNLRINFLHTDIREIEFEGTFDAVLCVGTTFGFFDDQENADVLRRMFNALRPSGKLLLDVTNRDYVLGSQPNLVWFQGEGCLCMEESDFNYFTSQLSMKRTLMQDDGRQTEVSYALRLYSLHELGQLLRMVGFRVLEVSGQEATRSMFFGCHSTRMIVLASRAAETEGA